MAKNHTTLQAITIATGIVFLFVATAVISPDFHKASLHIDSAHQELTATTNDKIKRYIPRLTSVFTGTFLEGIILIQLVSEQEPIPTLIRNYKFRPRSPPQIEN